MTKDSKASPVSMTWRAAVLALQVYEMTQSAVALDLACSWLRFLTYMQGGQDQRMLNFILDEAGVRNGNGKTSYPGGEPWSVRALQAYGMAWRVLRDGDFLDRYWRTPFPPTANCKYVAAYALSLTDVYQTQPDRGLEQWITDSCDMLVGSGPEYLRDECGKGEVELYSYFQLAAVARAGRLLKHDEYIEAGIATAQYLAKPVIEGGFYHVYPGTRGPQSVFDVPALGLGLRSSTTPLRTLNIATWCYAAPPGWMGRIQLEWRSINQKPADAMTRCFCPARSM